MREILQIFGANILRRLKGKRILGMGRDMRLTIKLSIIGGGRMELSSFTFIKMEIQEKQNLFPYMIGKNNLLHIILVSIIFGPIFNYFSV